MASHGEQAVSGLALGVDVGGTTVKAGVVDLATGALVGSRGSLPTPRPPTIAAIVDAVADAVGRLAPALPGHELAGLPLGVSLSGDVRDGTHTSGVCLDPTWTDAPVRPLLEERLRRPVRILNDADAAGIAEIRYGAGREAGGVVILLTFGTGIGSAIFADRHLLPNTGFGQFPFHGTDVEQLLSAVARERRGISWREWVVELNEFLSVVDGLLRPDLLIAGGGASEAWDAWASLLVGTPRVVRAELGMSAGIVGAAADAAGAPDGVRSDRGRAG